MGCWLVHLMAGVMLSHAYAGDTALLARGQSWQGPRPAVMAQLERATDEPLRPVIYFDAPPTMSQQRLLR